MTSKDKIAGSERTARLPTHQSISTAESSSVRGKPAPPKIEADTNEWPFPRFGVNRKTGKIVEVDGSPLKVPVIEYRHIKKDESSSGGSPVSENKPIQTGMKTLEDIGPFGGMDGADMTVDVLRASAIKDLKKADELMFKVPELRTRFEQHLIDSVEYIMWKFNLSEEDLK